MAQYDNKKMQEIHFKILSMEAALSRNGDKVLANRIRDIRMSITAAKHPSPTTAKEDGEG